MAGPTRAERFRPAELIGLAFGFALFAGVVVFFVTRDLTLAGIFLGVTFIVALVILAMLALAVRPSADEQADIDRLHEQPSDNPPQSDQ